MDLAAFALFKNFKCLYLSDDFRNHIPSKHISKKSAADLLQAVFSYLHGDTVYLHICS